MSIRFSALVCSTVLFVASAALAQTQTPSPAGATVYFINLKDGDTVTSPFKVQFGLTGMGNRAGSACRTSAPATITWSSTPSSRTRSSSGQSPPTPSMCISVAARPRPR